MKYQSRAFEVKSMEEGEDAYKFAGYGSVYGVVDSYDDIMQAGCFEESLQKRTPAMLWQHDTKSPIGVYEVVKSTDNALYVEGKLIKGVQQAEDAYKLMKAGAIKGLSVGFRMQDFEYQKNLRVIKKADLFEISLVTMPANELAQVQSVKSTAMTEREFERILHDVLGFSQKEAKTIIAKGYKALSHRDDVDNEQINSLINKLKEINNGIKQPS